MRAFRRVSNSVIGQVFVKLHSHSLGLGMGYIHASCHASGISFSCKHAEIYFHIQVLIFELRFCNILFDICDGPAALCFGRLRKQGGHALYHQCRSFPIFFLTFEFFVKKHQFVNII